MLIIDDNRVYRRPKGFPFTFVIFIMLEIIFFIKKKIKTEKKRTVQYEMWRAKKNNYFLLYFIISNLPLQCNHSMCMIPKQSKAMYIRSPYFCYSVIVIRSWSLLTNHIKLLNNFKEFYFFMPFRRLTKSGIKIFSLNPRL